MRCSYEVFFFFSLATKCRKNRARRNREAFNLMCQRILEVRDVSNFHIRIQCSHITCSIHTHMAIVRRDAAVCDETKRSLLIFRGEQRTTVFFSVILLLFSVFSTSRRSNDIWLRLQHNFMRLVQTAATIYVIQLTLIARIMLVASLTYFASIGIAKNTIIYCFYYWILWKSLIGNTADHASSVSARLTKHLHVQIDFFQFHSHIERPRARTQ